MVTVGADPPERPSEAITPQTREHCRQLYLIRADWRHYLGDYERCLAR